MTKVNRFGAVLFSSCRNTHVGSKECQCLLTLTLFSISLKKNISGDICGQPGQLVSFQ